MSRFMRAIACCDLWGHRHMFFIGLKYGLLVWKEGSPLVWVNFVFYSLNCGQKCYILSIQQRTICWGSKTCLYHLKVQMTWSNQDRDWVVVLILLLWVLALKSIKMYGLGQHNMVKRETQVREQYLKWNPVYGNGLYLQKHEREYHWL